MFTFQAAASLERKKKSMQKMLFFRREIPGQLPLESAVNLESHINLVIFSKEIPVANAC